MAINDIVQTIAEARVDARSLSEFVFKPANFIVSRRLAPSINTLQYYIDRANSVNNAFSKSVSDATAAADIAISAANTANQNAIGLIDSVTSQASQTVQNAISGVAIDANLVTDALTTVVPLHSGATSMTQLDKNRENVSVMDFFTKAELTSYRSSPTTFDAARPIQAFFDYININNVGTAYCTGDFRISNGIVVGSGNTKTKLVVGDFSLFALNAIDIMINFLCGQDFSWKGSVIVRGTGSASYASRTCRVGIQIAGSALSSRNNFDLLSANNFRDVGVYFANLSTLSTAASIRLSLCGSGYSSAGYSLTGSFSNVVNLGSSGSTSQMSTITVSTLPPENPATAMFIVIDGEHYAIQDVDRTDNKLSVFPWIDITKTSGDFSYLFGAGVYTLGGDSGIIKLGKVDCITSSFALWECALYPAVVDNLVCQFNAVGHGIAGYASSAHVGGQINGFYCENNDTDILRVTRASISKAILGQYALNLDKIKGCYAPRFSSNVLNYSRPLLDGLIINYKGKLLAPDNHSKDISITSGSRNEVVINANTIQLNLFIDKTEYESFKYNNRLVTILGSTTQAPAGTITVSPPVGFMVNGQEQLVYSSNKTALRLMFIYSGGTDIIVIQLSPTASYEAAKGTTLQRPVAPKIGAVYYDTTLLATGKPISWNGTAWVDALGETV